MRRSGFTLIELLVVIMILGILITIAGLAFIGAPEKARQTACMKHLNDIYKCIMSYSGDQGAFPWAGDSAPFIDHWNVLIKELNYKIKPDLFICPSMGLSPAKKDPVTKQFQLQRENCGYAYSSVPRTETDEELLAGDRDFKSGGRGRGHPNLVIVLSASGNVDKIKVKEGQTWEQVTRGELKRD